MGSPITLSGFNSIDFNQILTAIMTQESQPLRALQTRQSTLQSRANTFNQLTTRAAAVQAAATRLADPAVQAGFAATTSDPSTVTASATSSAIAGSYVIAVDATAQAQVTASTTAAATPDTIVASGGAITIGGVTVTLAGATTLRQLADAINATGNPPARASVVQSGPSSYRLVLSARDTGAANAFAITNGLTGGSGVAFADSDADGTSGDSPADNAVNAADASIRVNNISITSTTNTIDAAVPGVTLTLLKPGASTTVTVAADSSALKTRIGEFVSAYNDFVKFADDQTQAAGRGEGASIGRDPVLRQLRSQLRSTLSREVTTGGAFTSLSQVGIEFTRTGTLEIKDAVLSEALRNRAGIGALFTGSPGTPGTFAAVDTVLVAYTRADGLIPGARKVLTEQSSRLTDQISSLQERLAARRAALQREFIAADQAMSLLKSQSGSLASFGSSL